MWQTVRGEKKIMWPHVETLLFFFTDATITKLTLHYQCCQARYEFLWRGFVIFFSGKIKLFLLCIIIKFRSLLLMMRLD